MESMNGMALMNVGRAGRFAFNRTALVQVNFQASPSNGCDTVGGFWTTPPPQVVDYTSPSIEWGGFGACLPLIEWGRFGAVNNSQNEIVEMRVAAHFYWLGLGF
jgi:hypothetical protein